MPRYSSAKEHIESRIISKDGCWITNFPTSRGYPKGTIRGKGGRINRIAYEIYKGEIPKNMCVCHSCDNPACINPEHLFLGTQSENVLDRNNKNRQAKGSNTGSAKLTESQVDQIRGLLAEGNLTTRQIAKMFGVSSSGISSINNGKLWTHVDGIGKKINPRRLNTKLNEKQVVEIKKLLSEGMSAGKIAKLFGVAKSTIRAISQGRTWTHI